VRTWLCKLDLKKPIVIINARTALFENWVNVENLKILITWSILTSKKQKIKKLIGFSLHDVRTKTSWFSQKSENLPILVQTTP